MNNKSESRGKAAKRDARSGAVLGIALIAVVVFSVLGVGLLNQARVNGSLVEHSIGETEAFWAAEAGLEEAKAWAVKVALPFENNPKGLTWTGQVANVAYRVVINPDTFNYASIRKYEIVSTGTAPSGGSRTVQQHAEIGTFARFMWASRFEETTAGANISFTVGDSIDGVVYSNDQLNLNGHNPQFKTNANSVFCGVWSAASSVNYQNGADSGAFEGGLHVNAAPLNFYTNHVEYVKYYAQNGGLALTGDYAINFTNASMIYKKWASNKYGAPTTVVLTNYNGAFYVSGAVKEIQGTVDGNLTVAAGTTIQITNKLVYNSASNLPVASMNPFYIHDSLGLVARDGVKIMGTNAINIHAAILITTNSSTATFSGFSADKSGVNIKYPFINLYGSLSQYRRGVIGDVTSNGFLKNYRYDQRFLQNPPKYFPFSNYEFSNWKSL